MFVWLAGVHARNMCQKLWEASSCTHTKKKQNKKKANHTVLNSLYSFPETHIVSAHAERACAQAHMLCL